MQLKIKAIRDELESRHKTGAVKSAAEGGSMVPTKILQDEMFSLIYKLSKME